MANSKITFNNITVTGDNNTLIVGELRITTPAPGAIDIPQQAELVNSNVIFQKGDDIAFKNHIQFSPVRAFGIKLYDQCGYLCNTWEAERPDNTSGNVRISSETKSLFSNIEFPKELTGQTYLVISSYAGFESCIMDGTKKFLVEKDFQALKQKHDVSNVILFISQHIYKELNELRIDLTKIFKEVHSSPSSNLITHFTEFIAGKSVAGSRPSFQGMLKFGPGVEVSVARFRPVKNCRNIECQIRRGGRIQINSENENCVVKFFIILKHLNPNTIAISEEFTQSEFQIVPYTAENLPGLKPNHFTTLFDGFSFLEKINNFKETETLTKFINENQANVISYMFASTLNVFELMESDSELVQMIIEYGSTLRQQIYQLLITHATSTFTNINKKPRKYLNFNDDEMKHNYSHANQLANQFTNTNNGRLLSVPFCSTNYNANIDSDNE